MFQTIWIFKTKTHLGITSRWNVCNMYIIDQEYKHHPNHVCLSFPDPAFFPLRVMKETRESTYVHCTCICRQVHAKLDTTSLNRISSNIPGFETWESPNLWILTPPVIRVHPLRFPTCDLLIQRGEAASILLSRWPHALHRAGSFPGTAPSHHPRPQRSPDGLVDQGHYAGHSLSGLVLFKSRKKNPCLLQKVVETYGITV